jgi:hypothetical protein
MNARIEEVVEQAARWTGLDGVELVAQGRHEGRDCVLVHVSSEDAAASLPAAIGGYPVVVMLGDKFLAQRRGPDGSRD